MTTTKRGAMKSGILSRAGGAVAPMLPARALVSAAATLVLAVLLGAFTPSQADAQVRMTVPPQTQAVALQGATIHTVTQGVIENGTIVFENGVITAIGTDVEIPAGAQVVDATGKHIYPGLIDAYSAVGIAEIGSVDVSNDLNEIGDFNPNIRADVAVNAESRHIGTTRSAGVLVTLTTPGGGMVSGMSSAMNLEGWSWEEMSMESAAALNVNWPNPRGGRFRGFGGRRPANLPEGLEMPERPTYEGQVQELKDFFAEARAYRDALAAGEEVLSDSRYLAMIPALNGEIPVVVSAESAAQINDAVTWGQEEGLRIVIRGGRDAIHVADRLVANDIPVILTSTMSGPSRQYEGYDGAYTMPARLHEAGGSLRHLRRLGFALLQPAALGGRRRGGVRAARGGGAQGGDHQRGRVHGDRRPGRLTRARQAGHPADHHRNPPGPDQRYRAGLHPGPRARHDGHPEALLREVHDEADAKDAGDQLVVDRPGGPWANPVSCFRRGPRVAGPLGRIVLRYPV